MDIRELCFGRVNWIDVADYRDWWQSVVNAVINLQVSRRQDIS
jgi:hypothetical protein